MTKPDKKEEEKPFSEDKSKAHKNEPKEKKRLFGKRRDC